MTINVPLVYFNHITAAVRHVMSYHYNVYLLCYSRHVGHSSHVQSILAIVWPILVCQDIVAGQQRILIISSDIVQQLHVGVILVLHPYGPVTNLCSVCEISYSRYENIKQ